MMRMNNKIFALAACGLTWMALAVPPSTAQGPRVETRTQSNTGNTTRSAPPPRQAPPPRASSSRPTRNSSGARANSGSSNRSTRSTGSTRRATPPQSPRDTRGGRDFQSYRDTKRVERVGDYSDRTNTRIRRDANPVDHNRPRQRPQGYEYNYRNHGRGWYGYSHRYYDGYYGYYGPSMYCYYGAFGFWFPSALTYYGSFGYGPGYYGARRGYRTPRTIYVDDYGSRTGALDLDVSPEEAEIYIDGNYVGIADQFDGWPRFLWLEEGSYEVAIYREGYETIVRTYSIHPGAVIDVVDRMRKGEAVHPHDMAPAPQVHRVNEESASEPAIIGKEGNPAEIGADIGRIVLSVEPPDAAIYLDGHFLGTGTEVAGLRSGLVIDPGSHSLEVARPGYQAREIELEVAAGEKLDLMVELERE